MEVDVVGDPRGLGTTACCLTKHNRLLPVLRLGFRVRVRVRVTSTRHSRLLPWAAVDSAQRLGAAVGAPHRAPRAPTGHHVAPRSTTGHHRPPQGIT